MHHLIPSIRFYKIVYWFVKWKLITLCHFLLLFLKDKTVDKAFQKSPNFVTNSSYLISDLKPRSNFRQPLMLRLLFSIHSCLCLNLPGQSGQNLQIASQWRTRCWYHPSTFIERSSRVCSSHKNPPSHYLSISLASGRVAVQWKWNDILELVNSRSIMTVLLGFHFRIIYNLADQ